MAVIRACIVDAYDLMDRMGLAQKAVKAALKVLGAVVDGDDKGYIHRVPLMRDSVGSRRL